VLVCVSFGKRNAAVGDDGAVPVSGGGSERAELLAAARQVDPEAAVRVVDVQQAADLSIFPLAPKTDNRHRPRL
jgi:hypothetical protein